MNPNEIADLSSVSPQQTFLESHAEKPAADSTLYIYRFTTTNSDKSQDHTVTGVHIVLAKGNPNGLWEALHVDRSQKLDPHNPKVATHSLVICCDTLEVHGEFCVPEAEVAIYARRLKWATADAAINTSPLLWAVPKAQNASGSTPGENGAAGRKAGSFKVFVSTVEPAADSRPRLLALGGRGQDPGAGKDGTDGKSMQSWSSDYFGAKDKTTNVVSSATVNFDPPYVFCKFEWWWLAKWGSGQRGEDAFPTDGTNALAPGIPGDGGNGGGLTTNLAALVPSFHNPGGQAGTKEGDCRGGFAGQPNSCAKYFLKLTLNLGGTDHADYTLDKTASNTPTKDGTGAQALGPPHGPGTTPKPEVVKEANAWVHPLGLLKALEYARDLFLAGERDELQQLLSAYESALAQPVPTKGAWGDGSEAQWTGGQSEVAAMLQRLHGHLDYFGNAAGYTPLLSLQGTIKLYTEETQRALRTLLLVGWIDAKEREAKETATALGDAIGTLTADTNKAAEQVTNAEAKISEVTNRINVLEQDLNRMSNQLAILRSDLLTKAQNKLDEQARIKFAINMAAAVCQIVPVGQPALGTIGKLAGVAADLIGDDDGSKVPDTVSKMGDVLKKAKEAADKAKAASDKAKKDKGKDPPADAKSAKANASAWAKAGKGLGPALSQVSQGLKALQVSESEVEAELQRLESQSEEWKNQVKAIRDLNERKAALFTDLTDAFQALGEGYARISSNAAAIFSMQQERSKEIGKVDPVATGFVRQMGQRSRLTLLFYLYLVVKAYETTVLKPIQVDWKLSEITDKINTLLKPEAGFDAGLLNQQVKALTPLFQENVDTVRNKLLQDFSFNESTMTLQMILSRKETAEILEALNKGGQVIIDPLAYGLVLPDKQIARISDVTLAALEIDPDGPQLPDTTNMVVSLQPAHAGTIRKAEAIYSVYSDAPLAWSWTRLSSGELTPSKPSVSAEDILNLILGKDAEKIKQKVALPPIWSELALGVLYSPPLPPEQRPRITRLYFKFSCDVTAAPEFQRALTVVTLGSTGGAAIGCSPDMAQRGNGFDRMLRIYSKGATVKLRVPQSIAGAVFDSWDLIGGEIYQKGLKKTEVEFQLSDHVLAQCHWNRSQPQVRALAFTPVFDFQKLAEVATGQKDEKVLQELRAVIAAPPPPQDLLMRVEPSSTAVVVGLLPFLDDAELVEEGKNGWKLVNYRGIVGWVQV
jgi:predicted  nucleic acid-binding Zn-ribbon protein